MLRAIMEGAREPVGRLAYLACEFPVLTPTFAAAGVAGRAGGFRQLLPGPSLASRLRGRRVDLHARFVDAASTVARVAARLPGTSFPVTNHTVCNPYLLGVKLRVVRRGADPDRFAFRGARPPGDPARLLAVGALREKKGHHILIRAAGILRDREIPFRLDVVGDGPERDRPRAVVREPDLGRRVGIAAAEAARKTIEERHDVRRSVRPLAAELTEVLA